MYNFIIFSAWGACSHSYKRLARELSLNATAHVFSLPGFCSEKLPDSLDNSLYKEFIADKLLSSSSPESNNILIGHSFSANQILSSINSKIFERVGKIILVDPALSPGKKPFQDIILNDRIPSIFKFPFLISVHKKLSFKIKSYKKLYNLEFKLENFKLKISPDIKSKLIIISGIKNNNVHPYEIAENFCSINDLALVNHQGTTMSLISNPKEILNLVAQYR